MLGFLKPQNAAFGSELSDPNLFKPAPENQNQKNRLNTERGAVAAAPEGFPELIEQYEQNLKFNMDSYNRTPRLCKFVATSKFETLMSMPILYNCLTIAVSANCSGTCGREGQHWCTPCDEDTKLLLQVSEHILTFIFVCEWALRIYVFGLQWMKNPFNFFDSALVFVTGVMIVWILEPAGLAPESMRSIQVMRAFRLMRLARVVKTVPEFKEMYLLVAGLMDSLGTLFWSLLLILFLLYIFGIVATELIKNDEEAYDLSKEEDAYLHSLWSSLPRSMFTLIQFMTLDSWTGVARPMMERQPQIWMFFMIFIAIATFVLMNLVTAVIVNNALDVTKQDEQALMEQLENEKKAEFEKLSDLFYDLDSDGSGTVDRSEFKGAFELPAVRDKLKVLEFEQAELLQLFDLIDKDGGGELELSEFNKGLRQLKGTAKSKDLMALQSNLGHCLKTLNDVTGRKEGDSVSQKPSLSIEKFAPEALAEVRETMEWLGQQVSAMEERFRPASEHSSRKDSRVGSESEMKPGNENLGDGNAEASPDEKIVCMDSDVQNLADGITSFKTWGQGIDDQLSRIAQCLEAIADQDAPAQALGQFAKTGRGVGQMLGGSSPGPMLGGDQGFRAGTAPSQQGYSPIDISPGGDFPTSYGSERPVTSPDIHIPHFAELREAAQSSGYDQALMNLEPKQVLI